MRPEVYDAAPFVTDERLAQWTPLALLLAFGLLVVGLYWVDWGKEPDEDDEASFWAPPLAPDFDDIEVRLRSSDRG